MISRLVKFTSNVRLVLLISRLVEVTSKVMLG